MGSTVYERELDSIEFRSEDEENEEDESLEDESEEETPFVPLDEHTSVNATRFTVTFERDAPEGNLLIRGANVIAMAGSTLTQMSNPLQDQDLLITDNRIAAIGARGSFEIPEETDIVEAYGNWIIPGMIDTHAHWEFRAGDVLEPTNWSVAVNLAMGVTSGLDVQTSNHDYFVYLSLIHI